MVEDLLRKYRPAGPRADLRARILVPERPAWPWAAAAAALLALTVGLHVATRTLAARATESGADPFGFEARVILLSETLGGSEEARRLARLLVTEEELGRRLATPPVLPEPPR